VDGDSVDGDSVDGRRPGDDHGVEGFSRPPATAGS
jgi:hypothetical protein